MIPGGGWSEPAATNAPVEDEAVEAVLGMNQNDILPAQSFFFPLPLLCPKKFLSYLPTSPLLPPISYLQLPSPEPPISYLQLPSLELECCRLERIAIARAGSRAGDNVGPTRGSFQGKLPHLLSFSFFCCSAVKKAMTTKPPLPSFLCFVVTRRRK